MVKQFKLGQYGRTWFESKLSTLFVDGVIIGLLDAGANPATSTKSILALMWHSKA